MSRRWANVPAEFLGEKPDRGLEVIRFAKKDRDNIDDDELDAFRHLAKSYGTLTDQQINRLVQNGDLTEICHDDKA